MGYTPATNSQPPLSWPDKCQRMASSFSWRNCRCTQSEHLIFGFSQIPRTHSLPHAGEYPALPVLRLTKRRAYTSGRPRKSERKNAIFSSVKKNDHRPCSSLPLPLTFHHPSFLIISSRAASMRSSCSAWQREVEPYCPRCRLSPSRKLNSRGLPGAHDVPGDWVTWRSIWPRSLPGATDRAPAA